LIFMMMMMMMILYNYIKMYDEENIKFATAQKAKQIYQYKTVYTDACTTHCTITVYTDACTTHCTITVYTDACTTHCTLTVYTSVYKPSS